MSFPVFDLHCDTALKLVEEDLRGGGKLSENSCHIDLKRGAKLSGYAQCFACFTTPDMEKWYGVSPVVLFERELEAIRREMAVNQNCIRQAYSAKDVESNLNNGLISGILTIEGPAGFGYDPELLYDLYQVGFRISTLGWNEENPLTGSHITGGGLTELGKQYVKTAQDLGMIIDVSHISDEGFWDIMDVTNAPIIASHSNSRAVWDCSRNLTDQMFREIAKTGGVTGMNLYTDFLGENVTIDTICDHIFHFLEMDPDGKHIALGGDLDGCETLPDGFQGIDDYEKLAQRLLQRGLSQQIVQNIFWNNAMEVVNKCCT